MGLIIPNLFLAGVPKAGTSSLARWMADHPEIEGGTAKELRVLMDRDDPLARTEGYWQSGLDGFARYFPAAGTKPATRYRLNATPKYYYQQTAKSVIPKLSQARIMLRVRSRSIHRVLHGSREIFPSGTVKKFLKSVYMRLNTMLGGEQLF